MNQIPQIQPGTALVITGPQGCGKTRMAHQLARSIGGTFREVGIAELLQDPPSRDALEGVAVLIVNDVDPVHLAKHPKQLHRLKDLVATRRIAYRPAYQVHMVEVDLPTLIFTTNDTEAAWALWEHDRRMALHDMSPARAHA